MRRVSVVGILIGGLADIATTYITLIPVMIVAAVYLKVSAPDADQVKALTTAMHSNSVLRTIMLFMGCLCSILGGYVSARIAKRAELLNGALSASIGIALSILSLASGRSEEPLWLSIFSIVISPILGAMGGYVWARQSRKRAALPASGAIFPG